MCLHPTDDAQVLGMRLNRTQGRQPRTKTGIAVSICKCRGCGLNFAQPLPIPKSISDHYGVPPETYWKDAYFQPGPNYFQRQIADAKRLLCFEPGMTALDIGAGIGKAMITLQNAGFDTWGIEPSEPFLNKAIERNSIPRDRIQLAAIEDANFADEQFHFITFGAVLEHLYDPANSIEKTIKWLKPGGVIQIEVPSSNHLIPSFLNAYYRLVGTNYVTNLSPMHPPYHLYAFTLKSFVEHGKRAGYTVAYSYSDVASIRHFPRILHAPLRAWMKARDTGMQLTVWLRRDAGIG